MKAKYVLFIKVNEFTLHELVASKAHHHNSKWNFKIRTYADTKMAVVSFYILFYIVDTSSKNGQQIYDLACDGLHYLDTRTDFWRQQKPMYSRKREKQERLRGKQKKGNHESYVINQLERIDRGIVNCLFYCLFFFASLYLNVNVNLYLQD